MNIISIEELRKSYHDSEVAVHALNGINLIIEKGEFTAIVGSSGSGKTTLLNMIGGLDSPDSGCIRIGDVDITSMLGGEQAS